MGIILMAVPKLGGGMQLSMELQCDEPEAIFCKGRQVFQHPDGFIGCHAAAMDAGWLERQGPRGRSWICPACSGK